MNSLPLERANLTINAAAFAAFAFCGVGYLDTVLVKLGRRTDGR